MDRKNFWISYLTEINKVTDLYKNVSAGNSPWICRIKCQKDNVSVFNIENHQIMIDFLCETVPKFESAFEIPLKELKKKLP
jgi:hypothetical protein